METAKIHIAAQSLRFYRRSAFQQCIIIALLAAVITGSLLTGYSVRQTLKKSVNEKLGRTGAVISSGLRYVNPDLADRLQNESGKKCIPVLETEGFTQNFTTGERSLRTKILGINKAFFTFHKLNNVDLKAGEVAINSNLAGKLKVKEGEDIILNTIPVDDIPRGSPFAPSNSGDNSAVCRVVKILSSTDGGDFSLGISQITPDNLFLNLEDRLFRGKANRILIENMTGENEKVLSAYLKKVLSPEDIGLSMRLVRRTGELEIISSRIFIDQSIIENIKSIIPDSKPVLTYLANSISHGDLTTPYSFVASIDDKNFPEVGDRKSIIVNNWLAADLNIHAGDTISLYWYAPGKLRDLVEKDTKLVVSGIKMINGKWADSLLMPEFPGIAGSKTCTEWDAGVDIKMERIRKKDEEYWNRYRGTPKAFIAYSEGKELWGNNFGPATALRLPSSYKEHDLTKLFRSGLNPSSAGFTIRNIRKEMIKAADNSIDFGALFLSLGFFIIVSCLVLLTLSLSSYLDSRKEQILTFKSIGFRNKWIKQVILLETGTIAFAGSLIGSLAGILISFLMITALNSVWSGAVQTNSLDAVPGIMPLVSGFLITMLISSFLLYVRIGLFLHKKKREERFNIPSRSQKMSSIAFYALCLLSVSLLTFNFTTTTKSLMISFCTGSVLFVTLLFLCKKLVAGVSETDGKPINTRQIVSRRYYAFHPSKAIMPVLLIGAGLFAVVITGVNRVRITSQSMSSEGGTGGYQLWAETSVPIKEDVNNITGRKAFGLDETLFTGVTFIQARKGAGDDASCLNLNLVASPPLLGINTADFIKNRSFSFSSIIKAGQKSDPWRIIDSGPSGNTIFGFADQTVLEWGLRKKTGDTLKFRTESGDQLNIVIAGGLKSSVFQGYLLISEDNFNRYWPSVAGYSVFLIKSDNKLTDDISAILKDRFGNYGISVQKATERLASFFRVTNTYLSVFTMLGGFGMILGVIGLGLVLHRNYTSRRKEFALLITSGFTIERIKGIILREQIFILIAGIITGITSGLISASASVERFNEIPWISILSIAFAIGITGMVSIVVSLNGIKHHSLISILRKE